MKATISILFLLFCIISNSQTDVDLLETAYQNKSKVLLGKVFENWHKKSKKLTIEEIESLNDTLKETYKVFNSFYKPKELNLIGGSEFGDSIYQSIKYALIDNSICIYMKDKIYYSASEVDSYIVKSIMGLKIDSTKKTYYTTKVKGKFIPWVQENFKPEDIYSGENKNITQIDCIDNFYPSIEDSTLKQINLTREIDKTLDSFLQDSHTRFGSSGLMNIAKESGTSKERKLFLENYIKIYYGHWGGYWQLATYPTVSKVIFDKNFEYAKVCYRIVYEGYETILKKEGGKWQIISSERTWIE